MWLLFFFETLSLKHPKPALLFILLKNKYIPNKDQEKRLSGFMINNEVLTIKNVVIFKLQNKL